MAGFLEGFGASDRLSSLAERWPAGQASIILPRLSLGAWKASVGLPREAMC